MNQEASKYIKKESPLESELSITEEEFQTLLAMISTATTATASTELKSSLSKLRRLVINQLLAENVPLTEIKESVIKGYAHAIVKQQLALRNGTQTQAQIQIQGVKRSHTGTELTQRNDNVSTTDIPSTITNANSNANANADDDDGTNHIDLTMAIKREDDDEDEEIVADKLVIGVGTGNVRPAHDDDDEEDGVRPRKKIKIKLEDHEDDDEGGENQSGYVKDKEPIKLIIPSLKKRRDSAIIDTATSASAENSDSYIPSVYRPDNGSALEHIDMEELLKVAQDQLHFYNDEDNRASAKDELGFKKRKYAVSHFPDSDLKDLLPGEIPMTDFSGPKPTQQVAWNSFTAYIEPFFRNFNEEDIKFLKQRFIASTFLSKFLNLHDAEISEIANNGTLSTPQISTLNMDGTIDTDSVEAAHKAKAISENVLNPYYIPPLGPRYSDVWAMENEGKSIKLGRLSQSLASKMKKANSAKGTPDNFESSKLENIVSICEDPDKVSCGPLTSRILSAIVSDSEDDVFKFDGKNGNGKSTKGKAKAKVKAEEQEKDQMEDHFSNTDTTTRMVDKMSFDQLEKRLNRELQYIGIFMNVVQTLNDSSWEQDWALGKEDDEVSSELRRLQSELTKTQNENNRRKEILIPIIEEQIAWQEYMMIVEDLDKQVEQHYRRRINVTPKKSKKKGSHEESETSGTLLKDDAAHLVSNASFRGLLDKRSRWIDKIGCLFKSPLEMRRMPEESVFAMRKEDDEDHENGADDDRQGAEGEEGENVDIGVADAEAGADTTKDNDVSLQTSDKTSEIAGEPKNMENGDDSTASSSGKAAANTETTNFNSIDLNGNSTAVDKPKTVPNSVDEDNEDEDEDEDNDEEDEDDDEDDNDDVDNNGNDNDVGNVNDEEEEEEDEVDEDEDDEEEDDEDDEDDDEEEEGDNDVDGEQEAVPEDEDDEDDEEEDEEDEMDVDLDLDMDIGQL